MSVIDEHSKRLTAFDPLHPAGNLLDLLEPAGDVSEIDSVDQPHGRRHQAIRHVMIADHPRPHRHRLASGREQERLLTAAALDHLGCHFGRRVHADRERRPAEMFGEAGGDRIVGIEHGETVGGQMLENLRFRAAIVRQRVVKVEMIAADVRHASRVQLDPVDARLGQGVARHFDHGMSAAGGLHPA